MDMGWRMYMKIVILERNSVGLDISMEGFSRFGEVITYPNTVTEEEVIERIEDADVVVGNKAPLTEKTLQGAKNVKLKTTTGGKALKFFASIRLDVRKIDTLKQGNSPVGNRTRIKVVKNKVAPPFRVAEFDIIYGEGVSKEGSILDMGVANKIITKTGAWFSYGDIRIGQGRENARNFLRDNPELCKEIEKKLRDLIETAHDETAPVSEDEPYSEDE